MPSGERGQVLELCRRIQSLVWQAWEWLIDRDRSGEARTEGRGAESTENLFISSMSEGQSNKEIFFSPSFYKY